MLFLLLTRINWAISMNKLKVEIQTHGCKLNIADSQSAAKSFYESGHTVLEPKNRSAPDVFILNSCTVTHVADSKARQAIRKARRDHPNALIVMTGCYAEREKTTIEKMEEVDLVVPNTQKGSLVEKVLSSLSFEERLTNVDIKEYPLIGRSRASIKIQEGCDQVCSYCIIPSVRGRERSIEPNKIIDQINEFYKFGIKEVVLTGTQLGNYGFDLDQVNLEVLLKSILDETLIPRIRVSSLQPKEITPSILQLWTKEGLQRLCPHFHIPLQSGSDHVLKRMRRKYNSNEFLNIVGRVRDMIPDVSITSDVIVGFPVETETDFNQTLSTVDAAKFSDVHVFPYSKRPGTSSFYSKDFISAGKIKERSKILRSKVSCLSEIVKNSLIGEARSILWEGSNKTHGLTQDYFKVERRFSNFPEEDITNEKLLSVDNQVIIV